MTANDDIDADLEIEKLLKNIIHEKEENDIKDQQELFKKWSNEQETNLKDQIKNFLIEEKKKSILQRLNYLESQEEILTFFDNKDRIKISYFNRGFPKENPSDIPLKTEEGQFAQIFDRHFKPYKNKNKPARLTTKSNTRLIMEESLNKLYNEKSTT